MSHTVDFQYKYTNGETWASGYISIDTNKFEFSCSYLFNNPLEELLNTVYQIVPNLAAFPRKEITFIMLDEPIEYKWEFKLVEEKNVTINIYKKDNDLKRELVFEDICTVDNLLKALIYCIKSNNILQSNENVERVYKEFKLYLKSH